MKPLNIENLADEAVSEYDKLEEFISHAEVILGKRRGHLGVINYLVSEGLSHKLAKEMSLPIFDQAKKRIMKKQRLIRYFGFFLIFIGIATPLALIALGGRIVVVSAAPVLGGMFILNRTINPKKLPI